MFFEYQILNKFYKTGKFKINVPSFNNLPEKIKPNLRNKINEKLNYFNLNNKDFENKTYNLNLFVNEDCAIYHFFEEKNTTFYFNYLTNFYFYNFFHFFEIGRNFIQNEIEDYNIKLDYIKNLEIYLINLLFLKEFNIEKFNNEITNKINNFFQFNNFLLPFFSYFDIILFSIIIFTPIFTQITNSKEENNKNNLIYFHRHIKYILTSFNLFPEKIFQFFNSKAKENLSFSYKLTSSKNLIESVLKNDYNSTLNLLKNQHLNVESRREKDFKTLAHLACMNCNKEILNLLITFNANLESLDIEKMTPLYDGIYSGNTNFVDYLLNTLHLNLNHKEIQNRTPFYWSCCTTKIEMVKYLLKTHKIDINSTSSMGRSPLSKACWNGRWDIVELLCSQEGIILDSPDKNNRYPLHNACWGEFGGREGKKMSGGEVSDCPKAAECLIKHGCNIEVRDNEENTPFMIAASTNGIDSMKILYKYGARINNVNYKGETGLVQAIQYGNWESVKNLLSFKGIDLEIKDKLGFRAVENCVVFKRVLCLKLVFEYEKKYFNENDLNDFLSLCVECESFLCFEFLFEKFINVCENDNKILSLFEKICCMKFIKFFNVVYENSKEKIINLIINDEKFDLEKIWLILHEFESNFNENKSVNLCDENNKKTLKEKEEIYCEIMKSKMNSVDMNLYNLLEKFENDLTKIEYENFKNYIKNLIEIIYENQSKKNILNYILIKLSIFYTKENFFNLILNNNNNNNKISENNEILLNENLFDFYKNEKKVIKKKNVYKNSNFPELLKNFNNNNILSLTIENSNEIYFNKIMNFPFIYSNEIFKKLKYNKKNILHVLFSGNFLNKFEIIIKIIENENNNNNNLIENKFLPLINENDIFSMNSLDILLKNRNEIFLEKATKILNNLFKKYNINNNNLNNNIINYKILNFSIISTEKNFSDSYKNYIINSLKSTQSKIKEKNLTSKLSNFIINKEIINFTNFITNLIKNNKIEKEFLISNENYLKKFIDSENDLNQMILEIENEKILGIDAEFFGNTNENEGIICIIQISSTKKTYVIDTIKLHNLIEKKLKSIFEDENKIKIFHGCDNDFLFILTNFNIFTKNIFDTERAFLIFQNVLLSKQMKSENFQSLNFLVKFFFDVKLDKSYQKSDWRIRPLTNNMFQYALNDAKTVLYLFFLFQGLFVFVNNEKEFFFDDLENKNYFQKISEKFFENKEKLNENFFNKISNEDKKNILLKIENKTLEMIKNKIKNKYNNLSIKLLNE